MGNLKNIMKADIKRRTKEKANALTIKEKIMIQERVAKFEMRILDKEEAMVREM